MKSYQITQTLGTFYLFPVPVVQNEKFLIKSESLYSAEILKKCLDQEYLASPLENENLYQDLGLHTDQQTKIFEIHPTSFHLKLLPTRDYDLKKSHTIESILSKRILNLINSEPKNRDNTKSELLHRYETQLSCSECRKLGISSEKLKNWLELL